MSDQNEFDFWQWVKDQLFTPAKQFTIWEEPPDPNGEVVAASGEHYFRLRVAQMFLKYGSVLFKGYRPVVQSNVEYSFGNKRIEIGNVADMAKHFETDDDHNRFVARNFTLLPLMPFQGGTVRVVAGLFGMPENDTLKKFVTSMSQVAGVLALPQLSAALQFAQPVADGVRSLFSEGKLRVGYFNELNGKGQAAPHLRQQSVALIAAEKKELAKVQFRVDGSQLYDGDKPFVAHDFMLLRFDIETKRDDFNALANIATPFSAALEALADNKPDEANARYREAVRAVITAPELTRVDQRRVATLLKDEYDSMKQQLAGAGLKAATGTFDLNEHMRFRAMPVEEALKMGDAEYEEFV